MPLLVYVILPPAPPLHSPPSPRASFHLDAVTPRQSQFCSWLEGSLWAHLRLGILNEQPQGTGLSEMHCTFCFLLLL